MKITESHLDVDLSGRLWACLGHYPKITEVTIENSSLLLPTSAVSLPQITTFTAKYLPAESYASIIGKLSNLTHLEVHLEHANDEICQILHGLRSTGQQLIALSLSCEEFEGNRTLSDECAARLAEVIQRNTKKLEELYLYHLYVSEESQVSLLESCMKVPTLQEIT